MNYDGYLSHIQTQIDSIKSEFPNYTLQPSTPAEQAKLMYVTRMLHYRNYPKTTSIISTLMTQVNDEMVRRWVRDCNAHNSNIYNAEEDLKRLVAEHFEKVRASLIHNK